MEGFENAAPKPDTENIKARIANNYSGKPVWLIGDDIEYNEEGDYWHGSAVVGSDSGRFVIDFELYIFEKDGVRTYSDLRIYPA